MTPGSKCKNTLKPLLGAYLLIRKKNVISRRASSIHIGTKRNSSNPIQKEATFCFECSLLNGSFKQLVNQDKSCIFDIISYVQTKYFRPFPKLLCNICHPRKNILLNHCREFSRSALQPSQSYPVVHLNILNMDHDYIINAAQDYRTSLN